MKRTRLRLAPLTLTIFLIACGAGDAIKSFRLALAASSPLTNSLVATGAITDTVATAIVGDFDAGAQCAEVLHADFKAVPKDASDREKRAQKLNASVKGLRCWRVIMDRRNFAAHPRIQQAADIADGILASLVVFYSEPGEMRASAEPRAIVARDESDLEKQLKIRVKELERALKP